MKKNIAVTLFLISMVELCGLGIAGSPNTIPGYVEERDGWFYGDSSSLVWNEGAIWPVLVPKTGQRVQYGPRDDGKLRKGVAWPKPRFTDNHNGTVRDNLTGLIWLKDANCRVFYDGDVSDPDWNARLWDQALEAANKLQSGYCGLTDGSVAGNWRLPNASELQSLVDYAFSGPALPNTWGTGQWTEGKPFSDVQPLMYWSSTSLISGYAHWVQLEFGFDMAVQTTFLSAFVWPVRGGGTTTSPAPVPKTGQKATYGERDDGKLRKGVAWPKPRFMDNGNGTVTDNLTGLIWLQNASCDRFWAADAIGQNSRDWNDALVAANRLGNGYCGLTDGSRVSDWRLPNIKELRSLIHNGFMNLTLPNTAGTGQWKQGDPFLGVTRNFYWSSTSSASDLTEAWFVDFQYGHHVFIPKSDQYYQYCVWPVRGGQ
jgi:hypothetical protein